MYVLSRFNDVSSKRSVNFLCSTDLRGFCWQPPEDALPPMLMAQLPFLPLIAFVVTDPKNITGKRAVVSWVREMFEKRSRRKHMQTRSSFKVDGKYMYIYIYTYIFAVDPAGVCKNMVVLDCKFGRSHGFPGPRGVFQQPSVFLNGSTSQNRLEACTYCILPKRIDKGWNEYHVLPTFG